MMPDPTMRSMMRMARMIWAMLLLVSLVTAALAAAQEAPGPILRTELAQDAAVLGQPITLRISVLVPTWMSRPPVFPSFEMTNLLVRLPEGASRPMSERISGETWSGVTRAYRLSPMAARRFRIAPQPVTVTFADPETRAPVTMTLQTEEVVFAGIAPPGTEDLRPFIAAEALTLEQAIEGIPDELAPGDALTRTVTARVTGTSPIFLPSLIPPLVAQGIAVYPKEPVVTESWEAGTVAGERVETVTYMMEAGGRWSAPPVRVRWYNLRAKRVETTEVDGVEIAAHASVLASLSALDWRAVAGWILLVVLLAVPTRAYVVRRRPRIKEWRRQRSEAYRASEAFAFSEATAALRAHDLGKTIGAVDLWSLRLPPVSHEEPVRLANALAHLGAALYGRDGRCATEELWSTAVEALRAARRERRTAARTTLASHTLPPLNPGRWS